MFAAIIDIAAKCGWRFWSPIGDCYYHIVVIGGQITAMHIIKENFLPD